MKLNNYSKTALTFLSGAILAGAISASAAGSTTSSTETQAIQPCGRGNGIHKNLTDAERAAHRDQMDTQAASLLGISKTDLQAKLTAGIKMSDIVKASGISETDFRTKMDAVRQADMKTRLAADVASGKITQAQADQMITNMKNHTGMGMGHGKGGRNANTSTSPTTTTNQ